MYAREESEARKIGTGVKGHIIRQPKLTFLGVLAEATFILVDKKTWEGFENKYWHKQSDIFFPNVFYSI